jgi:hyaluronan synthase
MGKIKSVLRFLASISIAILLIGSMTVAYIMGWTLFPIGIAQVGLYGVIIVCYMLVQLLFSCLNMFWLVPGMEKQYQGLNKSDPSVGVQVVGWKEEESLFRNCLVSVKGLTYSNIKRIVVVVDGKDSKEDETMSTVFQQIFPNGITIRLNQLPDTIPNYDFTNYLTNNSPICIMQPHAGKRHAMYTSCKLLIQDKCDWLFLTDSDTVLAPDCINQMIKLTADDKVGAVTGFVDIFNLENWLSYLTSLRYWFAFHLERSAQSFWGTVTCVSGPLGLYRARDVALVLDKWVKQKFLGKECTYGDDRHLTNVVLGLGQKIYFTPKATCKTETPTNLLRWIAQQTRWSKSFYREILYNVSSFHKHSPWLATELLLQGFYPFFLMATLLWYVSIANLTLMILVPTIAVILGLVRISFAIALTRQFKFIWYSWYTFLYMLFLLPCKLFAVLTLWDNDWGTSSRSVVVNRLSRAIHALVWAVGITCAYVGVSIWVAVDEHQSVQLATAIAALIVAGWLLLLFLGWLFILVRYRNNLYTPENNPV